MFADYEIEKINVSKSGNGWGRAIWRKLRYWWRDWIWRWRGGGGGSVPGLSQVSRLSRYGEWDKRNRGKCALNWSYSYPFLISNVISNIDNYGQSATLELFSVWFSTKSGFEGEALCSIPITETSSLLRLHPPPSDASPLST